MLNVDDAVIQIAERLRKDGLSWARISAAVGLDYETIRRRLDPEFATQRRQSIQLARKRRERLHEKGGPTPKRGHIRANRYGGVAPEEAARVLRQLPRDTRSLTARAMGDPLPGRSALEQKYAQGSEQPKSALYGSGANWDSVRVRRDGISPPVPPHETGSALAGGSSMPHER